MKNKLVISYRILYIGERREEDVITVYNGTFAEWFEAYSGNEPVSRLLRIYSVIPLNL